MCEFAKLTPIQLLEETEKAVGDPNLPVQHRQLIEWSKELRNLEVVSINLQCFPQHLKLLWLHSYTRSLTYQPID